MKTKAKHLMGKTVSLIIDLAISASGLNETMDVKKIVTDFFMYSHLLWLQLRNRLVSASRRMISWMIKHKTFFAYTLLIPAGAAFLLPFTTPAIPVLVIMMMAGKMMKKKRQEDNFASEPFP